MHITRLLRRKMTPQEWSLWRILCNRQIKNAKFRRQSKVGPYVADFVCLSARLIIEIDGWHNNTQEYKAADEKRQKYLENQGFKVRFWNNEIDNNLEGVVAMISEYL